MHKQRVGTKTKNVVHEGHNSPQHFEKVVTVNVGANKFKREKKKAIELLKSSGFTDYEARRSVNEYLKTGVVPEPK